jgi:hypothetical protein
VDVPWLGSNNLTDGLSYQNRLPLYLDVNNVGTFRCEMTTPLQLNQDIPQIFTMSVYNRDGTPVDANKVLFVSCQFSYGSSTVAGF